MMSTSIENAWRMDLPARRIERGWVQPDRDVARAEARRAEQRAEATAQPVESGRVDAYA